jgi:hypothetical protein
MSEETPTAHTIRLIQEEERERCAKICDDRAATWKVSRQGPCSLPLEEECEDIAAAIRRDSRVRGPRRWREGRNSVKTAQ